MGYKVKGSSWGPRGKCKDITERVWDTEISWFENKPQKNVLSIICTWAFSCTLKQIETVNIRKKYTFFFLFLL